MTSMAANSDETSSDAKADASSLQGGYDENPLRKTRLHQMSSEECCHNDDLLREASRALAGIVEGMSDSSDGGFSNWLERRKSYWTITKAKVSVEKARSFYRDAVKKKNEAFYSELDCLFDTQLSCYFYQPSYGMPDLLEFAEKINNIGIPIEDKEDYVLQKVQYFVGNVVVTNETRKRKIVMVMKMVEVFLEKAFLNIEKHCLQKHGLELMAFFGLEKEVILQEPYLPQDIINPPSSSLPLEPFDLSNFKADLSGRYKPIVSPKDNFPMWLNTNKRYWDRLRRRKAKIDALEPDDRQKVMDKFIAIMNEYTNERLSYDDESNYVEDTGEYIPSSSYSAKAFYDSFNLYYTPKIAPSDMPNPYIYVDVNLKIAGFEHIKKHLSNYHPGEVTLGLPVDRQDRQGLAGNPCYSYINSPLPGWTKEVLVRMNGQRKGNIDIAYMSPIDGKRVRSKVDMQQYLARHKLSAESYLPKFDFHSVFCVCHKPEEAELNYLECSLGKGGCNGWLHTDCIGLGKLTKSQIEAMPAVVCPLCVLYLEGTGEEYLMNGKLVSREITCQVPPTFVYINGIQIKESTKKHELWGIEGSKVSFGITKQRNPVPTFNSTASYSEKVRYKVDTANNKVISSAAGSKPRGRPPNPNPNPNPTPNNPNTVPLPNIVASPVSQIPSAPSTPVTSLIHNLPRIFQHRLLAGFLKSDCLADTIDNDERNITKNITNDFEQLPESDSSDQGDDISYDIDPRGRTRIVRRDDGSVCSVGITGGFMESQIADAIDVNKGPVTVLDGNQKKASVESGSTLSKRYHEDIIDTAISFCYPAQRKKLNIFSTCQQQKHVYNLEKPLINLLPCEDGGLRAVCISSATTPRSLHQQCIDRVICAYCISVVSDDYKEIKDKKDEKKGVKTKRKRSGKDETFSQEIDRAFKLVDRAMGAVTYSLHPQCNERVSIDMNRMNPQSINSDLDNPADKMCDDEFSARTTKYLTPSDFYEYDEVDEVICDLCGRCGGVIQFFDIAENSTTLSPPSGEGWMAHPFCIHWLSHSGLLEPRVIANSDDDKITDNCNLHIPCKSAFDKLMDNWRCSLCSLHVGIVARCSALGCAVRAHPLCVSVAGEPHWTLCSFTGVSDISGSKSPGFLCSAHSKQNLIFN